MTKKKKDRYEEGYENGQEDQKDEIDGSSMLGGICIGVIALLILLGCCGVFNTTIDKLDLNEDALARYHVLKYYPEYANCSIEYGVVDSNGWTSFYGAGIYCDEKDNRDGMRVVKESKPTIEIEFEDVSLREILDEILIKYK